MALPKRRNKQKFKRRRDRTYQPAFNSRGRLPDIQTELEPDLPEYDTLERPWRLEDGVSTFEDWLNEIHRPGDYLEDGSFFGESFLEPSGGDSGYYDPDHEGE